MAISLSDMQRLAATCAPSVDRGTLQAIVATESGFDPLSISVNRPRPARLHPQSWEAATSAAATFLVTGANIDVGLAQINSANLGKLGLSISAAFDPCQNLAAAARLLTANYQQAYRINPDPQAALRTALSLYNTGDTARGFRNGYVARVSLAADSLSPSITARRHKAASTLIAAVQATPAWDVFGDRRSSAVVFDSSKPGDFR